MGPRIAAMPTIDRNHLEVVEPEARWPGRLRALAAQWRAAEDGTRREAILAEFWRLLNLALHRHVRAQARRFGGLSSEDVVDIAADKAVDLLGSLEAGRWDPAAEGDERMAAFLAVVARNGVVDRLRRLGREQSAPDVREGGRAGGIGPHGRTHADADDVVGAAIDGGRYARALVECARLLTARARLAWVLHIFGGMTSAQIAGHPEVRTSVGGVSLMLHRCRHRLRRCLASKGFEPERMPAGTFIALWDLVEGARRRAPRHPGEGRS
jgi:DNA-directed RNA polymerase specialized sigma24 family protein